jgi:hypothetical protein
MRVQFKCPFRIFAMDMAEHDCAARVRGGYGDAEETV